MWWLPQLFFNRPITLLRLMITEERLVSRNRSLLYKNRRKCNNIDLYLNTTEGSIHIRKCEKSCIYSCTHICLAVNHNYNHWNVVVFVVVGAGTYLGFTLAFQITWRNKQLLWFMRLNFAFVSGFTWDLFQNSNFSFHFYQLMNYCNLITNLKFFMTPHWVRGNIIIVI